MTKFRLGNVRLLEMAAGAAVLAMAAQTASCSGDDTGNATDAGADQTTDGPPNEGGSGDGGSDARNETGSDAPADAPPEADAAIDAPPLGSFITVLAQTFCSRLEQCCLATSATWDQTKCATLFSNPRFGGVLGVGYAAEAFDGGHINYNPSLASQCLAQVAAAPCGLVATTQLNAIQSLCLSAVAGSIANGGMGCTSSYECAPTGFCQLPDGGTGTCLALVGDGGACTSEFECSYLTNGPPSLYCDMGSHTCVPRVGVDAGCSDNSMCATNHCVYANGAATCVDKGVVSDPGVPGGICDFFTIHDAGGGG